MANDYCNTATITISRQTAKYEHMSPFEGIVEFVAVAETQGFTAAARRLGVSTSHISRRVADLETRLGTALVARTTRKVKLTSSGQNYYHRCHELLHGLEEANESVSDKHIELTGTLRVSAAGEFAENYVVPALLEFASRHPGLSIDVDFNTRIVNFVEEGIDFAVRYGSLKDSGLIARKLVDRSLVAAASPSYLEHWGTPKHPRELTQHQCLIAASDRWRFDIEQGSYDLRVSGRWRSNSGRSIVNACRAGLGIAYLPRSSFGTALSDGSLTEILSPYIGRGASSWIVYANRKHLPSRARLSIQYLLDYFETWDEFTE